MTTSIANARPDATQPARTESTEVTVTGENGFMSSGAFSLMQRVAKCLSNSGLVPDHFQGERNIANCVVALEMAARINAAPLAVMQNLYVIQGRPSWSSPFIIAVINSSGKFSSLLRFALKDLGEKEVTYTYWVGEKGNRQKKEGKLKIHDWECCAWTTEKGTNERIDGPAVSIEMAVKEGWYTKHDSKWQTLPQLMLRYRSAAFFGRLYTPESLMGIRTVDEVEDIEAAGRVYPVEAIEPPPVAAAPANPVSPPAPIADTPTSEDASQATPPAVQQPTPASDPPADQAAADVPSTPVTPAAEPPLPESSSAGLKEEFEAKLAGATTLEEVEAVGKAIGAAKKDLLPAHSKALRANYAAARDRLKAVAAP